MGQCPFNGLYYFLECFLPSLLTAPSSHTDLFPGLQPTVQGIFGIKTFTGVRPCVWNTFFGCLHGWLQGLKCYQDSLSLHLITTSGAWCFCSAIPGFSSQSSGHQCGLQGKKRESAANELKKWKTRFHKVGKRPGEKRKQKQIIKLQKASLETWHCLLSQHPGG